MFIDVIGIMEAAGQYPLPPSTGKYFVYPGPKNNDGILLEDTDASEAEKTFELITKMANDLTIKSSGVLKTLPPPNVTWYRT